MLRLDGGGPKGAGGRRRAGEGNETLPTLDVMKSHSKWVTLWLFNIAMENGPSIDGLPIKNGDFPWLC